MLAAHLRSEGCIKVLLKAEDFSGLPRSVEHYVRLWFWELLILK